jgi:RNA polymerase sigma-70 factor (ECF subfamily)
LLAVFARILTLHPDEQTRATAEAIARRSYGKLVAILAARTYDVGLAEDSLAEAFASALSHWPSHGIPERPEAWLLTVARNKMIDALRRKRSSVRAAAELAMITAQLHSDAKQSDDRLSLMFACAHPAIAPNARAPLVLQTVLGFDAATIASTFLISPTTMSQRLVRAKNKIKQAGIPFRVPSGNDLASRLDCVLEAIYATFAAGWSDPSGTEVQRRNLAEEGIWLGRLVVSLMPQEPETLGLLALMLYAEARRSARRSLEGKYVPLAEQDPELWNNAFIEEAESLLQRASRLARLGRYQLEAAVQSAHVVRRRAGSTDWHAIEYLYDALYALTASPVVAINRAVVIAETGGPETALAALDALKDDDRLINYQPYWAARAELLGRTGAIAAAKAAYQRAIGLENDPAVRQFLQQRERRLSTERI